VNVKLLGRGEEEDPERAPVKVTVKLLGRDDEDPDSRLVTEAIDEFPEEGPEYVEVKLFMEVTVDKLTLKVVVQASGSWRLTYVAVTGLMVVSAGRLTVVVVLHTPDGPGPWRLANPEGA
jgi:hypothetical protein